MLTLQAQEAYSFHKKYILEYSQNKAEIYQQFCSSLNWRIQLYNHPYV
jgi:hypothetical protein